MQSNITFLFLHSFSCVIIGYVVVHTRRCKLLSFFDDQAQAWPLKFLLQTGF